MFAASLLPSHVYGPDTNWKNSIFGGSLFGFPSLRRQIPELTWWEKWKHVWWLVHSLWHNSGEHTSLIVTMFGMRYKVFSSKQPIDAK